MASDSSNDQDLKIRRLKAELDLLKDNLEVKEARISVLENALKMILPELSVANSLLVHKLLK